MIELGKKRLLKNPERYVQKAYGYTEAGGTSVIYLTALPFDELGFKQVTKRALPEYTWEALRLVPGIFLTVGGGLSALAWITHRRERLREELEKERAALAAEEEKEGRE
jgi:formate dehydrogenase iron-sulfur subunit